MRAGDLPPPQRLCGKRVLHLLGVQHQFLQLAAGEAAQEAPVRQMRLL